LEALADEGQTELNRAIEDFNRQSDAWTQHAKEFRNFQSGRRSFERAINRSPAWIAVLSIGVPLVLGVAQLILS
jgi:hypothetical protein